MMRLWLIVVSVILTACSSIQSSPPLAECNETGSPLPDYQSSQTIGFVTVVEQQLQIDGRDFHIRGINYYPARYPWRRFLTETDLDSVRTEFDLLQRAGFNSLRLFLWYDVLFDCPGSGVPNHDAFTRLDNIIHIAAEHDFRLIIVLHDMPDLTDYPLYSSPQHTQAQTAFIITRYRDEAAILAWDMRNEGDIDYGSWTAYFGRFHRIDVLHWLAQTAAQIRALDTNHLLTAGWLHDAGSTAPYVDFVSFHHWDDSASLERRIRGLRNYTDKPILLQEVGYSTFNRTDDEQAHMIEAAVRTADTSGLVGWMVWTAFDFPRDRTCVPSPCESVDNAEHHFGLWTSDYTPRSAALWLMDYIVGSR